MTDTTTHPHTTWCGPPPGEDEPRMESYRAPSYNEQGHVIRYTQVRRCCDCGNATYDGELRD